MAAGVLLLYSPLNDPRRPAVTHIAELHPQVVLMTETGDVPDWARPLLAEVLVVSRLDVPGAATAVRALLDRRNAVADGVVSLSETGLFFCSELAQSLGLRFTPPETLKRARDKSLMRAVFAEHGLPTVPFERVAALPEALAAAARIGYPVVLKPLLAGGSLYVIAVPDAAALAAAFEEALRGGGQVVGGDPLVVAAFRGGTAPRLLVEKLIEGRTLFDSALDLPVGEISVEGCVSDEEVRVLARHDKPLPANGPHFEEVLWSSPSRVPADLLPEIDAVAAAAVRALGLQDTVFHAEMRTTADGPVLLEVAARMGGGPIFRSALLSSGNDLVATMLAIARGDPLPDRDARPPQCVMTFGVFAEEGLLLAIEGLDEVRGHPQVVEVCVYEHPGTYIHRAPRSDHCTVHVMVATPDFDAAEAVGAWACDRIGFVTASAEPAAGQ